MSVDLKMTPADALAALTQLHNDLVSRLKNAGKELFDKLRDLETLREPRDLREADLAFSIDGTVFYDNPSQISLNLGGQQLGYTDMIKPVSKGRYRFLIYGYRMKEKSETCVHGTVDGHACRLCGDWSK